MTNNILRMYSIIYFIEGVNEFKALRIEYTSTLDNFFQCNHNRNIKNKQYIVAEEKLTFILRAFKISFVSLDNISFVISWDTKTNLCKYNNIRTKVADYFFQGI